MTSEGNSVLLPANVDRSRDLFHKFVNENVFFFVGYIQQITLRLFPRETVNFASVDSASANIEILGKQN